MEKGRQCGERGAVRRRRGRVEKRRQCGEGEVVDNARVEG